jgi:membrane-bound lytic murein transglycosylase B
MNPRPTFMMRWAGLLAVTALGGLAAMPLQAVQPAPPRPVADTDAARYADREDAMALADSIAERRNLDPAWVRQQIAKARFVPAVTRLIMPPPAGTAKNWAAYRARFVEPVRIRAGLDWWAAHADWLARAEERFGVPAEIVVSIVGIETLYGRHMGNFRVLDALTTLSLDFPTGRRDRSGFFRDELEAFLAWTHREGQDPAQPRGSFAGAIGLPQFMPSSILKYGVDFNGNGHVDLQRSTADVVGSVAHYLAEFGWKRGMPTTFSVEVPVDTSDRAALLAPDILPTFTAAQFAERGARLAPEAAAVQSLLALVELQNGDAAPSYVAGTSNFYAITRYNWSSYYAMAVIDLAEELKQRRTALLQRSGPPANR